MPCCMRVHGGITLLVCTHRTSEAIKSLYRAGLVLSPCLSCSLRKFALPLAGSIVRAASNTGGDWA
jgi:hypothetical protein